MKSVLFAAIIAFAAAQDEEAAPEAPASNCVDECLEGECCSTDAELGESACALDDGVTVCDAPAEEGAAEEEASTTLYASAAALAAAAAIMY